LLNIAPSNGLLPGKPYGYEGPELDRQTVVDQIGSFNDGYARDAYATHFLNQGVIPFWNPYQGLGQPFLVVGSSATIYAINWLHSILPPAWWDIIFLLQWLLGSIFLYAYLRVLDIEQGPAMIGALAVLGCGTIAVYLPVREAVWLPLLLYAVERTYQEPAWRGRHIVLAIGVIGSITGGQPEVSFINLLAVTLYAVCRILTSRKTSARLTSAGLTWALVPGATAGLLISAPHWVNFANYAFSSFSEHTPDFDKGSIHLPLITIGSYVFPYFYGRIKLTPFSSAPFNWNYSAGWAAPLSLSFALASIACLRRKPRLVPAFLSVISILVLAKTFNAPGTGWISAVPYLQLVIFPRYAAFVPAFLLAGLSAFGISFLARAGNRAWLFWIGAWTAFVLVAFALAVFSVRPALARSAANADARQTFLVFGLGGLAWALIQPLGLFWVKSRWPGDSIALYAFAAFGILLQAAALAPGGYSLKTYSSLSILGLSSYITAALAIGFVRGKRMLIGVNVAAFAIVGVLPVFASAFGANGLPRRYNPLAAPPYLAVLSTLQEEGLYKSYSLGPVPGPDFAAPFELSSLDNVDPIAPIGTNGFMHRLDSDPGQSALYFVGHRRPAATLPTSALEQIKLNKRYYDLAAVKYLVTTDKVIGADDPNDYDSLAAFLNVASPVPVTEPLHATFTPATSEISAIEVPIGTYGRNNPGGVRLQVLDDAGRLLESSEVASMNLRNNGDCDFRLSRLKGLKKKPLGLVLDFRPESHDSMIAAYSPPDTSVIGFAFRALSPEKPFLLVFRDHETGTAVWENRGATPRVFLAPEVRSASSSEEALSRLDDIPDLSRAVLVEGSASQPDSDPSRPPGVLREFHLSPNEVTVKYSANTPGILTLVDAFSDGWHAEVNGHETPVLRVDGVFRGVRIDRPGDVSVHFWYRPPLWRLSLILCGLGLIILLLSYSLGFAGTGRNVSSSG
jgi:hypothetical protein